MKLSYNRIQIDSDDLWCTGIFAILQDEVGRYVITHKDRLLRLGADLVFAICEDKQAEVVIFNQGEDTQRESGFEEAGIQHQNYLCVDLSKFGGTEKRMTETRAIQPSDLYQLRALAEPQMSADGRFTALVVIAVDKEQDGYIYELHLMDIQSGHVSIISSGANKLRSPRFSPDGGQLAFIVSQEEHGEHVYVGETSI